MATFARAEWFKGRHLFSWDLGSDWCGQGLLICYAYQCDDVVFVVDLKRISLSWTAVLYDCRFFEMGQISSHWGSWVIWDVCGGNTRITVCFSGNKLWWLDQGASSVSKHLWAEVWGCLAVDRQTGWGSTSLSLTIELPKCMYIKMWTLKPDCFKFFFFSQAPTQLCFCSHGLLTGTDLGDGGRGGFTFHTGPLARRLSPSCFTVWNLVTIKILLTLRYFQEPPISQPYTLETIICCSEAVWGIKFVSFSFWGFSVQE